MANKTKIVDALLTRIKESVDSGILVTLEDAVTLEALYQDYLESREENLSKSLGLRHRVNRSKEIEKYPDFYGFLVESLKQQFPTNKVIGTYLSLYLEKRIPIAKLFGERSRKNRNDIGDLEERFMADLADKTLEIIRTNHGRKLVTGNETLGETGSLYKLLADLSGDKEIHQIAEFHELDITPQLISLKAYIDDEKGYIDLPITASRWREAHKRQKEEDRKRQKRNVSS